MSAALEVLPHSRPSLGPAEVRAAQRVLRTNAVAQGAEVAAFEEEVAGAVGRRWGVAVSSGTTALTLVLRALGIGAGDLVLAPSYACTALVYAARGAGAEVRLVDVDADTGNLDVGAARAAVAGCAAAIVPHMFGRPAAGLPPLAAGLPVVEDLAMALGADGVGTVGVAAVCSFYATKVITSGGEGGMVLADDEGLAQTVRGLRQYDGLPLEGVRGNAKLTDLAAAVGRAQLRRLGEFVERRRTLAARYDRELADLGLRRPAPNPSDIHYRYVVGLDGGPVDGAIARLEALGVAARRPVAQPVHRQLAAAGAFPGTEAMWRAALSLPLYPSLTDRQAARVVAAAHRTLSPATAAA